MDRDTLLRRFEAEYMEMASITPERRSQQLRLLRRLADSLDHPLTELTPGDVQSFIGADLARGLHVNTGRKHMGMIRSFITWAAQAGLIDPMLALQLKSVRNPRGSTGRSLPKPYTVTEIRHFRELLSAKYPALPEYGAGSRAMRLFMSGRHQRLRRHLWRHARRLQFEAQVALALEQGLRRTEVFHLSMAAVHYDNDGVVVQTAKQGPGSQITRTVPYTTHARACVQEWLDFRSLLRPDHDQPWLALDYTAPLPAQVAPLTFRAMGTSLAAFGDGWQWKRFRHTAATEWLRSGVPLEKVRVYMGHATIEQTLAYAQILDSDVNHAFGTAEADFARRLGLAA